MGIVCFPGNSNALLSDGIGSDKTRVRWKSKSS